MEGDVVKAILFDFDNTLVETSRVGTLAIKKAGELLKTTLSLDDDTVDIICKKFRLKLLHETFDRAGGKSIDDVRVGHMEESIEEATGDASTGSLASQCYYVWKNSRLETLRMSPEISRLLTELRRSYKLLLLTNGEAQSQKEKVEAAGCAEFFDAVVVGGDYAEQKPCVSIFGLCFEKLRVQARDCVMVGDSLSTDVQGGFNAGVRATVWINPTGDAPPEGSVTPDFTIPTVLDLPGILTQVK